MSPDMNRKLYLYMVLTVSNGEALPGFLLFEFRPVSTSEIHSTSSEKPSEQKHFLLHCVGSSDVFGGFYSVYRAPYPCPLSVKATHRLPLHVRG